MTFSLPLKTPPIGECVGLALLLLATGCSSIGVPDGVQPVRGFEADRYLGTWHEIARLDHSFERGLTQVTATYSLRPDGSLTVLNRGFDASKQQWKEARGVARFLGERSVGSLKVSFFRPFYGGYHILALDREAYSYAMVCGPSRSYLWILAREPRLPKETLADLLEQAHRSGFNTNALIYP